MIPTALRPVGSHPAGRDQTRDTDPVPPPSATRKGSDLAVTLTVAELRAIVADVVAEQIAEVRGPSGRRGLPRRMLRSHEVCGRQVRVPARYDAVRSVGLFLPAKRRDELRLVRSPMRCE